MHTPRTSPAARKTLQRAITIIALACAALTIAPTAAGASDACGEYSFGFAGTRLLNDGISESAGPFSIELPAGTYDVTLVSSDHHSTQAQPDQTEEQWYVRLGDSWTSGLTVDLPDELDTITTTFTAQEIPAATEISVHHRGVGGVNSVDVVCVGFTTVAPADSDDATDEPVTEIVPPVDPIIPPAPAEEPPAEDAPTPETPIADEPEADLAPPVDPIIPPAPDQPIEVAGPQIESPDTDIAPPVTPEPADDIEPEVLGETETAPAPELALTGPHDAMIALTLAGLSMIALGSLLVSRERRRA